MKFTIAKKISKVAITGLALSSTWLSLMTLPTSGVVARADSPVRASAGNVSALATKIGDDDAILQMLQSDSQPVQNILDILNDSDFDWKFALFGSDSLTPSQTMTYNAIQPDMLNIATGSVTAETATAFVYAFVAHVQSVDPSISGDDIVAFLTTVVNGAQSELSTLLNSLSEPSVAQDLRLSFSGYLSTSPQMQALFSPTGPNTSGATGDGGATGSGGGAAGGDGSTGSASGGGVATGGGSASSSGTSTSGSSAGGSNIGASGTVAGVTGSGTVGNVTGKLPPNLRLMTLDGKAVAVVPAIVRDKTTYMPIWYIMNIGSQYGITSKWKKGNSWYLQTSSSASLQLPNKKPGTGKLAIYINGKLVLRTNGLIGEDTNTNKATTFMPIWYVQQVMSMVGVKNTWNGTSWAFTK